METWAVLDCESAPVISTWASFGPEAAHSSHLRHDSLQPAVPDLGHGWAKQFWLTWESKSLWVLSLCKELLVLYL